MSAAETYRRVVARLQSWGFQINETSGCYGRSNGLGWALGGPVGHINHHYVCGMNPSQSYINSLVNGLMNGSTVNWFADVNGVGYLIGAGPMNHAGKGESAVLARTRAGKAPSGPSDAAGDMTGNTWYSGTELQHPGDSTPYPQPMVDVMVAISAAEALEFGFPAEAVIEHYDWTGRKIDMSLWGGRSSGGVAGNRMRSAVAARMSGGAPARPAPTPEREWYEMPLTQDVKDEIAAVVNGAVVGVLRHGEFAQTAAAEAQRVNDAVINVFRGDEFKQIVEDQVLDAIGSGAFAAKVNDLVIDVFRSGEVRGMLDAADGKIDNPKA